MPLLDSSDFSGGTVSHDSSARTYTITGGVRVVNNVLTAPAGGWGGYRIICNSSGGLQFTSGASGTLGGHIAPVVIQEASNGNTYGGADNYKAGGSGSSARIAGDSTNVMIFDNVRWEIDSSGGRKDFDIARGNASYQGPAVRFRGVEVIISGSQTCFNHQASRNWRCEPSAFRPYGLRVTNYTNNAAWEFSSPIDNAPTGAMVFIDTDPTNTANAHVAIQPGAIPANGVFTLTGLSCRRLAVVNGGSQNSTKTVRLIDPVGDIPRGNWSNEYETVFEIVRTQPFAFTGPANATGRLYCDAQDTNGRDVDVAIAANGTAAPQLLTQRSAHGSSSWTAVNNFRFHAVGLNFDKWYSGTTNIAIATAPTTRNVSLSARALPDGTALSSKTSGAVETAADIVNALVSYEIANPLFPSVSQRLITLSGSTATINTAELVLSTSASEFITRSSNTITLQTDTGGVDASGGIGLLNLGSSYNAPSGTLNLIGFPTTSSAGTSALINITAPVGFVGIRSNAGANLGTKDFTSAGSWSRLIPANQALADTRIGIARKGYTPQSRTIDISAGGTFSVVFPDLTQELDPLGAALYDSSLSTDGISVSFTLTGQPNINLGNAAYGVKEIYKKFHDSLVNPTGVSLACFNRQSIRYTVDPLSGNNLYLGADAQLRRSTNSGDSAAVIAAVYGGRGGEAVNDDRGDVIIKPGSDIARIQTALLKEFDLDDEEAGVQSVAALLVKIDNCSSMMGPKMAALKDETQVLRYQNRLLLQNAPLDPLPPPWTPDLILTGAPGMGHVHDVESRDWPVSGTNVTVRSGIDSTDGIVSGHIVFPAAGNGIVQAETYRRDGNLLITFTDEGAFQFSFKPTAFHATQRQSLITFGGMTILVNPSTGNTATLRIGGHNTEFVDTTLTLTKDSFNVIAGSIAKKRPDEDSYPYVNLAVNAGAAVQVNGSSDEAQGRVGNAIHFSIGNPTAGSSIVGEVREFLFHPNKERDIVQVAANDPRYPLTTAEIRPAGWVPPTGLVYDPDAVVYQVPDSNTPAPERTQGNAVDLVEEAVGKVDSKVGELPENTAAAVASRSLAGQTATKDGLLGERIKWLTDNVNTTTPETKEDIAAQIGSRTMPENPTPGTYDAAMKNAENANTTAPDSKADIATAVEDALTIPTPPTTSAIATAVANELTIPSAAQNAAAVSGALSIPTADDIATTTLEAINEDVIANGINRKAKEQIELATTSGTSSVDGSDVEFKDPGDQSTAETRITLTVGSEDGVRTAAVLPSPPSPEGE